MLREGRPRAVPFPAEHPRAANRHSQASPSFHLIFAFPRVMPWPFGTNPPRLEGQSCGPTGVADTGDESHDSQRPQLPVAMPIVRC